MTTNNLPRKFQFLFLFWIALLGTMASCMVGHPAAATPPAASSTAMVDNSLIYYPAYEVYYDPVNRDYWYNQAGIWITAVVPAGVSVKDLQDSPAVRMDFQGSPIDHHFRVMQKYPRDWQPPQPQ